MELELPHFSLVQKTSADLSDVAIIEMSYQTLNKSLACATSKQEIKVFSLEKGLSLTTVLKGHTARISKVFYSQTQPVIYSSSYDGTLRVWDTRTGKESRRFVVGSGEEIFCAGLSTGETLIAAGTSKNDVIVWDTATSTRRGTYNETHTDEITQVHFHPNRENELYSGSLDGLICVYDCSLGQTEDDTYLSALNAELSVSDFGFFSSSVSTNQNEYLWCTTHMETLSIWNLEKDSMEVSLGNSTRQKLTSLINKNNREDFLIHYLNNCSQINNGSSLLLFAGTVM
eukprot:TRINITY_DN2414_c0_g1_i1.p1 TRINITY_DN2414_c0_g1~~TRINITY_DN2414_c0_g1_i1.p1  ORF type:complete len:286 (-),score=47.98 TRINITY_DN2414_c0_g1_i1:530-1387(-)